MHPRRKQCTHYTQHTYTDQYLRIHSLRIIEVAMVDDDDDDVQLCLVSSLFVLAESDFVATVIASKRKVIPDDLNLKEKIGR